MQGARIGRSCSRSVAEKETVAGMAADLEAQRAEFRFAAFVVLIQVHQKGQDALLFWSDAR